MDSETIPSLADIEKAAELIGPYIYRTPVLTSNAINSLAQGELFFKCENFQKTGSFKIRGATNTIFSLPHDIAARGVATHSSGNHGAAVALAARWRNIRSYIVMPENAPEIKKRAVASYGGEIISCHSSVEGREEALKKVVEEKGATFIPPYNDYRVIAGQGTAALELCQEVPDLNLILIPIGGGGLTSGTALAVTEFAPKTKVIAVEPREADDAYCSFHSGEIFPSSYPNTVADGLRTSLGDKTFPIIRNYVTDIVTVTEEGIIATMRCIWERMKIVVEPSAAVPLAAVLTRRLKVADKRVGIILTGGNVDLDNLPWVQREEVDEG